MWDRIQHIFEQALAHPPETRDAFLHQACGDDAALRDRVSRLLDAHAELESSGDRGEHFAASINATLASALLEDAAGELAKGAQLGRYRIVRRAASGGMGIVYQAQDPRLDRPVALKVLPRWRSTDPVANQRLEQEARAASALDHPNIATVYEVGESESGRVYIAMAWYEGGTLRDRLAGAPLAVHEALDIAAAVADGLAAAHAGGIVHRDIKPENIAFGRDDRVAILDFGLASGELHGSASAGVTPGTAAYMSPEQARGEPVDARSDLWALGVVLYEMLAGRRPFEVAEDADGASRVVRDRAAPMRSVRPEVPPPLAALVHRCLEPDPDRRFASAADLLADLRMARDRALARRDAPLRHLAPLATAYLGVGVLAYLGASHATDRFLLPEWFTGAVLLLLVVGLPLVATTALLSRGANPRSNARAAGLFTWRGTLGGGVFAFSALAVVAGYMVLGGIPRVTGASGAPAAGLDERPRVLLADFEAPPGSDGLALATREALAVDLGQSGIVRVLDRHEVSTVMQRMGLAPSSTRDVETTREIAQRAGAGAIITGTVVIAGAQVVLTGRAFDPASGDELFAVRTAAGSGQVIRAVERLSREIRRRLGEDRAQIRQSRPLPEVTTHSLEALTLYAAAEERAASMDNDDAYDLLVEALRLDPSFAMAHRLAATSVKSGMSFGMSQYHIGHAYRLRDRLPERERRHVEGIFHITTTFDAARAEAAYRLLVERFPDDVRAWNNLGVVLHSWAGRHGDAVEAFEAALALDPHAAFALTNIAFIAPIIGDFQRAEEAARLAESRGVRDFYPRWRAVAAFAREDIATTVAICDSMLTGPIDAATAVFAEVCGSMDVAGGRLDAGIARLEAASRDHARAGRLRHAVHSAHGLAAAEALRGDPGRAGARLADVLEMLPPDEFEEPDRFISRVNLQVHAWLLGQADVARLVRRTYPPHADPEHWFARFGEALVAAAEHVAAGDGATALATLDEARVPGVTPIGWRSFQAILSGLALEQLGELEAAAIHLQEAAQPGFHLPPYLTKDRILLPFALEALARVEAARGRDEVAQSVRARLARLWVMAD